MTLMSPPISARASERGFQELLRELLFGYFNGALQTSLLGDQVVPQCDLFFNQTEIAAPTARPQIHSVFLALRATELWWGGRPGAWNALLAQPTGGVAYGVTLDDRVEETVHGSVTRSLPGTNIQWIADDSGLHEQVLQNGTWFETADFPGASAIRWTRDTSAYYQQVLTVGTTDDWTTVRTVYPDSTAWDGAKKKVSGAATVAHYIRVKNFGGGDNRSDFLCRQVADQLKELYQSADTIAALAAKGVRHAQATALPTPLQTTGFQVRLVTMRCQLEYFLPRLAE